MHPWKMLVVSWEHECRPWTTLVRMPVKCLIDLLSLTTGLSLPPSLARSYVKYVMSAQVLELTFLHLFLHRTRQASITTELTEIISGASALTG